MYINGYLDRNLQKAFTIRLTEKSYFSTLLPTSISFLQNFYLDLGESDFKVKHLS